MALRQKFVNLRGIWKIQTYQFAWPVRCRECGGSDIQREPTDTKESDWRNRYVNTITETKSWKPLLYPSTCILHNEGPTYPTLLLFSVMRKAGFCLKDWTWLLLKQNIPILSPQPSKHKCRTNKPSAQGNVTSVHIRNKTKCRATTSRVEDFVTQFLSWWHRVSFSTCFKRPYKRQARRLWYKRP
jgi:hypothetical protein